VLLLILFAAGGAIALCLGSLHRLDAFKLVNVVGIIYGLFGVIVLSEFVVQNERWRLFVVDTLSGILIWSHGAIPLGGAAVSAVLFFVAPIQYPSSQIVAKSFVTFFCYALLPTVFIGDFIFVPKFARFRDPLLRVRMLGLFLVLAGGILQLVAAVQDLTKP
jgi:hypothetical protein